MAKMAKTFKRIADPVAAVPRPTPARAVQPTTAKPTPPVTTTAADAPGNVHKAELSRDFLFAGRALFTASNAKTHEHFTYRIRARASEWPIGSGKKRTSYFLSVKHPGGRFPYSYIGIVDPATGSIKTTGKSNFRPGSREYDVARWAINVVMNGKLIPEHYHIEHAGKCGRCGRTLTDPESIKRGIGPECWSILHG